MEDIQLNDIFFYLTRGAKNLTRLANLRIHQSMTRIGRLNAHGVSIRDGPNDRCVNVTVNELYMRKNGEMIILCLAIPS